MVFTRVLNIITLFYNYKTKECHNKRAHKPHFNNIYFPKNQKPVMKFKINEPLYKSNLYTKREMKYHSNDQFLLPRG